METTRKLSRREKLSLIGKYLRPCWGHFAAALLCACLAMVFNALTPQIIRLTVDSILGPETPKLPGFLISWLNWAALEAQPLRALWWAAAAVLLTALLRGVCNYGQRLQLARGSESYVKGIRDDLYRHIQYLPFAWHKNNPTGDIIQRCTSDVDVIRQFVCNQLVEVVRTVFLIVLYLCIMFTMNLRLSLISALFIPIVGLSSGVFYKKISGRFQAADEAEGDLTTCAQENLTAVRVVRAFGRERYEEEKFNGKNQRFSQLWIRLGKLLSVYWASGTLLTCLQVMVIVVAGACECVAGRMTLGSFVAFVTYNEALAWPVRSLGRVLSDMSKAGVSMDRVGYILNAREERDLPDAVDAVNGDIVFDHVSFAYDQKDVLRDVSFTAKEGEVTALVGPSGSGKSTCARLAARLWDVTKGSIKVGGVDIATVDPEVLLRDYSMVFQDVVLFDDTVMENIRLGKRGASDEEVRAAFDAQVEADKQTYADPSMYEQALYYFGMTPYYVPEGYRGVTQILLQVDSELMSNYQGLQASLEEAQDEAEKANEGDASAPADASAEPTATPVTQADVDAAYAAILASVQPTVDEIKAKLAEALKGICTDERYLADMKQAGYDVFYMALSTFPPSLTKSAA